MTDRTSWSRKKRATFFQRHRGICCYCHGQIKATEAWDAAHIIDREMLFRRDRFTGEKVLMYPDIDPDGEDIQLPAHKKCHANYTFTAGVQQRTKADRLYDKHNGFRPPSTFPKRNDPWGKEYRSRS